jgi:hypothetical protein
MVKAAYTVGRFQPPTIGHKMLIEATIAAAKGGEAYVFVSSTQGSGKEKLKNPLTSAQKLPILKHMFPEGVTFVDTAKCDPKCGGALAAFLHLINEKKHAAEDITLVVGDDRKPDFGAAADIWKRKVEKDRFGPGGVPNEANFVYLKSDARDPDLEIKDAANMSGTKARQYVKKNRKEDFYMAIGGHTPAADTAYDVIKAVVGSGRSHRAKKDMSEVMTSADAEFEYPNGGRKTRRRRLTQSRASSRA